SHQHPRVRFDACDALTHLSDKYKYKLSKFLSNTILSSFSSLLSDSIPLLAVKAAGGITAINDIELPFSLLCALESSLLA
ncbi:hypothetical protein PMAYCL1PPCAC_19342, partial [Pristionchus mayeri]